MAITRFSSAVKSTLAQSIITAIDAGGSNATLQFYTGTMPATPSVGVSTQVLLGTLLCSRPVATESNGVITFAAITQDSSADNTGTATWVRLSTSAGIAIADYDVTDNAGSGSVKLNTTSIVVGGPILVTSFVITIN